MKLKILLILLSISLHDAKAQWQQGTGIYGGRMSDLFVMGNRMIAAVQDTGVYVSDDTGRTWQKTNNRINNLIKAGKYLYGNGWRSGDNGTTWTWNINLETQDVFPIGDSIIRQNSYGDGYCSTDSGNTWHSFDVNLSNWRILRHNNTAVYATTSFGVYRSTDNFGSWTQIDPGFPSATIRELYVEDSMILVGTNLGLFRSIDDGTNWTLVFSGAMSFPKISYKNGFYFLSTDDDLYRSSDSALSWQHVFESHSSTSVVTLGDALFVGNWHGIYKSEDEGFTWIPADSLINKSEVRKIVKCGNHLFGAWIRQPLVRSSNNGLTWQVVTLPGTVTNPQILDLYADGDTLCVTIHGQGVIVTKDYGASWTHLLPSEFIRCCLKKGNMYCVGALSKTMTSLDNGISWTTNTDVPLYGLRDFVLKDSVIYAGRSGDGVYRSYDYGISWIAGSENFHAVRLQENSGNLYAVTFFGSLLRSDDDGSTWQEIYPEHSGEYGNDVIVDGSEIWLIRQNFGVLYSPDAGITWVNTNLHQTETAYSLCLSDTFVFAATDMGVWQLNRSITPLSSGQSSKGFFVRVYPNPSSGIFTLVCGHASSGSLCIYDLLGNCILTQQLNNENNITLDLSDKAKGVYFIELRAGVKKLNQKIIIQ